MTNRQIVFQGRRVSLAVDTVTLVHGGTAQREIVLHPGAVTIIPMVDSDRVCLVRNHRHAVDATLWELPAGTLEPGEDPDHTAVRELAEETGYRAAHCRRLIDFYTSPGILSERMVLYLAEGLTPGPLSLDEGEELRPEVIAWSEALRWVGDGKIRDAKSLVGLLFYDRLRREQGHA
jgi:ADP-ribose pyrophosphatase